MILLHIFRNPLLQISLFSLEQKGCAYYEKSAYYESAFYERAQYHINIFIKIYQKFWL